MQKQKNKACSHAFFLDAGRHGAACDFHIETETEIFFVKLFGVKYKKSVLVFTYKSKYYFTSLRFYFLRQTTDSKEQGFNDYDFRKEFRKEWESKTPRRILLVNPVCCKIMYRQAHAPAKELCGGDIVHDYEIASLPRLISDLEKLHE